MDTVFFLLMFASLLAIVAGLIRPAWVVRWGVTRTRGRAVRVYGGLLLASTVMFALTMEPPQKSGDAAPVQNAAVAPATVQPGPQADPEAAKREAEAKEATRKKLQAEIAENEARVREKVLAFDKELMRLDSSSAVFMDVVKLSTKQLGQGNITVLDLYRGLKEASVAGQVSANAILALPIPDGLSDYVANKLRKAKDLFWQVSLGRRDVAKAFMTALDSKKVSDQALVDELSRNTNALTADAVLAMMDAKLAAGFSDDEVIPKGGAAPARNAPPTAVQAAKVEAPAGPSFEEKRAAYCAWVRDSKAMSKELDRQIGFDPQHGRQPGETLILESDLVASEMPKGKVGERAGKVIKFFKGTKIKVLERHFYGEHGPDLLYKVKGDAMTMEGDQIVRGEMVGYAEPIAIKLRADEVKAREYLTMFTKMKEQREAELKTKHPLAFDPEIRSRAFEEDWWVKCSR